MYNLKLSNAEKFIYDERVLIPKRKTRETINENLIKTGNRNRNFRF